MSTKSKSSPHVVVVGGGIVGSCIAWHLARDTKVTIVAENVGGTATPNSFAWINAAYGNPKFYFDLRKRSMARWRELSLEMPTLPVKWSGSVNWNMSADALVDYEATWSKQGYDIITVDKAAISEREPLLTDDALPASGVAVLEEGQVEAHVAARQFVEDAVSSKGAVHLDTTVTGFLKKDDGKISGVTTKDGQQVEADHVVVAAGLGTVPLLAAENITVPVTGRRGLLVNSRPTTKKLLNGIVNAQKLHLRQTLDGRILSGSEFAGGDPGDDPQKTAEEHFRKVQAALKGGDELEYDYYTIGVRPQPADGHPILGPTGLDGVTIAVMHSGVTNGPIVGQLLSKLILTGKSDPALADFRLDRFDKA
ncbi:FAD dependent oxidoreductase [Xylariomycetidae sp. FL2044]|nr:FAD dependent oxidoreductase [Xylariomycetidae sp. FL2044]